MRGWEQNASERNELPRERDAHRTKVVHRHTSQSAVETPLSQREKVGLQLPLQRNEDVFLLQTRSGSKQRGSNEIIRRTLSKCHHSYYPSTRQRNRGDDNNNNNSAAAALNQSQSGRERGSAVKLEPRRVWIQQHLLAKFVATPLVPSPAMFW